MTLDSGSRRGHPPVSHALVAIQFAGLALCCVPLGAASRSPLPLGLCVLGAILGVATLLYNRPGNFSVYPEPRQDARLITTGPYARVRHPMYSALLAMTLGIALYNGGWTNAAGFLVVTVAVVGKARLEERYLRARFVEYDAYAGRTRRFVPFVY